MQLSMVSTSDRPDLVPVVARWLWEAFWQDSGKEFEHLPEAVRKSSVTARLMPWTFILLADDVPVGTASLVEHDLDERPDLTPWLAGVFVGPCVRGLGHAGRLVSAVEQAARDAAIPTLWLYANKAERIYARAGWRTVETIQLGGNPFALMRRDFLP
jgi:GNAT superfamily N-acetyltransferase